MFAAAIYMIVGTCIAYVVTCVISGYRAEQAKYLRVIGSPHFLHFQTLVLREYRDTYPMDAGWRRITPRMLYEVYYPLKSIKESVPSAVDALFANVS